MASDLGVFGRTNSPLGPQGGDLPTMPDPTKGDPSGGQHLPAMPDPLNDPERGQELPTDPDPETKPPARIDDPPQEGEDREKRRA
jgi:hypothetical protein